MFITLNTYRELQRKLERSLLVTFEDVVDVRGVEVDSVIVLQSAAVIGHSVLSDDERRVVVFYSDPVE